MSHHAHDYKVKVTKDDKKNEVTIVGEISKKEFAEYTKESLSYLMKEYEIPGFRKGNVPEKIIREKVGIKGILEEAAEMALAHIYPHIVHDEKLDVVGRPTITLTKLAEGEELGFTIVVAVMPEIKGLDYKKIASKSNGEKVAVDEVTDKEVEDVIKQIKGAHLRRNGTEGVTVDEKTIEATELTDELVAQFGEFKSVEDFKTKVKENLSKEKEYRAQEKKRGGLFESLIENTDIVVPEALVENEKERMLMQFKGDVERMGITFADYMKHLKKTEEEIKAEWNKDAEKRAKLEIILDHISAKEKITADEKRIQEEVEALLNIHKTLDAEKAKQYVEGILAREAVITFLEGVK